MQESPKHDDTGMAKRIELSISPGSSLGPFRIGRCILSLRILQGTAVRILNTEMVSGTSIWDIITFLRERSSFFPQVELKYSQEVGVDKLYTTAVCRTGY